MNYTELKQVMEALGLLVEKKLISEKVGGNILGQYIENKHKEKQEQINRLNSVTMQSAEGLNRFIEQ